MHSTRTCVSRAVRGFPVETQDHLSSLTCVYRDASLDYYCLVITGRVKALRVRLSLSLLPPFQVLNFLKTYAPFACLKFGLFGLFFQPKQCFSLTTIQPEQCFSASFSQSSDQRTGPTCHLFLQGGTPNETFQKFCVKFVHQIV